MARNPFDAKNKRDRSIEVQQALEDWDNTLATMRRSGQEIESHDHLKELLNDTEQLLAYLGESPDAALWKIGDFFIESSHTFELVKRGDSEKNLKRIVREYVARGVDFTHMPLGAARRAYVAFKTAEGLRSDDPTAAIGHVARGAMFLAVAVSAASKTPQRKGAESRLKGNEAHRAREAAHGLWRERHEGKHQQLRRNEDFAAECMRRWPALKSAKVILGWCTDWNKEAKRKP